MSMVRTDALSHDYLIYEDEESDQGTPVRALSEVTIDIREGEFVSILGHNGSGKSTLAKHLNALLLPTEGTVWIEGMDTKDDVTQQLTDLIADMAAESLKLVPENACDEDPYVKNARSKADLLGKWAGGASGTAGGA